MNGYLKMMFFKQLLLRDEESIRRRRLRDAFNPLDIPAQLFIAKYRLSQEIFLMLCDRLRPLVPERRRRTGVPFELKVVTTLSFLATGSYQKMIAINCHSLKSVSRQIHEIVPLIESLLAEYIGFPRTKQQRNEIKQGFLDKFQFPNVLGCIDGIQIAIMAPKINEEIFFNRDDFHSMNALMICDSNFKILAICARFGGESEVDYIWEVMAIKPYIVEVSKHENLWLLGDSAFPLRPYLMTPILNAVPGSQEFKYTNMHCKARNCIEHCFGLLQARWRCLLNHRPLRFPPQMTGKIINACAVLHNIAISAKLPEPPHLQVTEDNYVRESGIELEYYHEFDEQGQLTQRKLIDSL